MNKKKTLLICLAILLAGGAVLAYIFFTEPSASREGASRQSAMLVDVEMVEQGSYQPLIVATGSVQPSADIVLSPRVSGEIISRSDAFVPGGFVKKGEVLLQIDPADFRNTLELRRSDLSQAMADLEIEQGRQNVARRDFELIDENITEENRELVLREPQLNAVKARVEAARAAVEQAKLQLERSTIRAPFDAHILSRNANVGSQVAPGDDLGRLVGRDVYWVVVNVPLSKLRWLTFPDKEGERGSEVTIRDRKAWQEGEYRTGYLYKLVGALEDQTRMARLLVAVPDPLAYQEESEGLPPLMINSFVEASIKGTEIKDVVRLNRDWVRQDETVWVMEDEKLSIREVDIVLSDAEYAYISKGLQENDQVVTTNLTTVAEGAELRRNNPDSAAGGGDTAATAAGQRRQGAQTMGGTR
ncbi:efflux RND transporter periplasmic adaptor subunit [Cesiribacter sp. SM1]|uniref:efflux RND transporter periplasmic adaptor subunit n=1 Tax=Cesiribacter sp. SM1 TaxID=2861196 RepID=UPI001CD3A34E|nr:efflux RND transporter periplasmic adaptor subunit [Cesiribacter sp. SM1]